MSYVRFSEDSNVYVYGGEKGLVCCGCLLHRVRNDWPEDLTAEEMADHLRDHVEAGHKVPPEVIQELDEEAKEEAKR